MWYAPKCDNPGISDYLFQWWMIIPAVFGSPLSAIVLAFFLWAMDEGFPTEEDY